MTDWDEDNIGQLVIDNVEIRNCSQKDTDRAALRVLNTAVEASSVTRSTIHSNHAWGVYVSGVSKGFLF